MNVTDSSYDFSAMHERMQFYIDQNILSCCATAVFKGTDLVDYQTFGYMNTESKTPLRKDAIFRMYSNTKLVTSVALMMLMMLLTLMRSLLPCTPVVSDASKTKGE